MKKYRVYIISTENVYEASCEDLIFLLFGSNVVEFGS